MNHTDGRDTGGLDEVIACRHCIHRILGHTLKLQEGSGACTVDGVGGTGHGRGTEWTAIHATTHVGHAFPVSLKTPRVGEQVVPKPDGLAALQVSEAWDKGAAVGLDPIADRTHQARQGLVQDVEAAPEPQAHIGGHLVVARAGSMQLARERADVLPQLGLHGHVDVFESDVRLPAGLEVRLYFGEALPDGRGLFGGEQTDLSEHGDVSHRPSDVLAPHEHVGVQALREGLHLGAGTALKATVPQGHYFFSCIRLRTCATVR